MTSSCCCSCCCSCCHLDRDLVNTTTDRWCFRLLFISLFFCFRVFKRERKDALGGFEHDAFNEVLLDICVDVSFVFFHPFYQQFGSAGLIFFQSMGPGITASNPYFGNRSNS